MYNTTYREVSTVDEFTEINIQKIHIIAHKSEPPGFEFYNPCRQSDGFVFFTSGSGYAITPDGNKHLIKKDDLLLLRKGDRYQLHFEGPCSYITSGYDIIFAENPDFALRLPYIINCPGNIIKKIFTLCNIWQERRWNSYSLCRISIISDWMSRKQIHGMITRKKRHVSSKRAIITNNNITPPH